MACPRVFALPAGISVSLSFGVNAAMRAFLVLKAPQCGIAPPMKGLSFRRVDGGGAEGRGSVSGGGKPYVQFLQAGERYDRALDASLRQMVPSSCRKRMQGVRRVMETLERRRIHDHQAGSPVKAQYRPAAVSLDFFLFHAHPLPLCGSREAVLASPWRPRIPPRVSAERRLLRTSRRIPRESASRQKPSEASGFMVDEQRFRRMKYRRFMSSLESTSDVSALACISFFPPGKRQAPCRARLAEILEFARKPGPYGVWIFRKTRTRPLRKTRKSALGFLAVPENVRPPPCPPASSGFPSRGSGLSSPGEPPCR